MFNKKIRTAIVALASAGFAVAAIATPATAAADTPTTVYHFPGGFDVIVTQPPMGGGPIGPVDKCVTLFIPGTPSYSWTWCASDPRTTRTSTGGSYNVTPPDLPGLA